MSTLTGAPGASFETTLSQVLRPAHRPWQHLKDTAAALGDGYRAYQTYEALRARGIPHAVAAAKAFDQA